MYVYLKNTALERNNKSTNLIMEDTKTKRKRSELVRLFEETWKFEYEEVKGKKKRKQRNDERIARTN